MGSRVKTSRGVALAVLLGVCGREMLGSEDRNPYSVIADRNAFHLNPAPAREAAPETNEPAVLPEVSVSGFVQSGGEWQVFMVIKGRKPNPSGVALSYLNLGEGDKKEVISDDKPVVIEVVKVVAAMVNRRT